MTKPTRTMMAKWYRKASVNDFRKKLKELELIKGKLQGAEIRKKGGLGKEANTIKNSRKEIALLLTIAKERGLKL